MKLKYDKKTTALLLLSLTLLAAACFVRAFYGFDWSDEAYYTALPYRYATGDALFSDGWEIHQLSVMFTVPLIRLFLLLSGGATTGIMLYMRLLFVLFQFGTSLFLFFSLRTRYGQTAGVAVAALALMFAHFALPNFSYDTLVILFSFLSFGFLVRMEDGRSPSVCACLSGLCYAFAVQAYPQYVLSFPVFLIFWALKINRSRGNALEKKRLACFLLGIGCAVVLFVLFVLRLSSFSALFANLRYLLTDPTHESQPLFRLFVDYVHVSAVVFGFALIPVIPLTAASALIWRMPSGEKKERTKSLLLIGIGAAAILLVLRMLLYDIHGYAKINFLAMPLSFLCPALLLLLDREKRPLPALLFFLGAVLSLGVQLLGSNMGLYASSFPLLISSAGSIIAFQENLDSLEGRLPRLARIVCLCSVLLLLSGISLLRLTALYRTDGTIAEQTCALSSGPAKGIRVHPDAAQKYEAVVREIKANAGSGPVLFARCLPFGYLCTDGCAGTPSVWSVSPNTERVTSYYRLNPDRLPETIFLMNLDIGYSNVTRDLDGYLRSLPPDVTYVESQMETCVVYRRSGSTPGQ